MKTRIIRYFKHLSLTFVGLLVVAMIVGLSFGASVRYGDHPAQYTMQHEGPYVYYESDSTLSIGYINGSRKEGYSLEQQLHSLDSVLPVDCYFSLDSSSFDFTINHEIESPEVIYNDGAPILAISDIESGYKTFRDFLINNQVINDELNWIFGEGHLVLPGDFVDRGNSTTQVLWFIYMLEQQAKISGGQVHYILGNHELKNLQGNYNSASEKYFRIASVLRKKPQELYSSDALLGRWLLSKNAVESINGVIFTHGGLHPELVQSGLTLPEMADIIRAHYDKIYYPKPTEDIVQKLTSNKTGPCWYRGYFEDDLDQQEVNQMLEYFNADAVVVGHTIQSKVNTFFNGKVIGIDVRHPKDYHKNWPAPTSEGLYVENGNYFRVLHTGERIAL